MLATLLVIGWSSPKSPLEVDLTLCELCIGEAVLGKDKRLLVFELRGLCRRELGSTAFRSTMVYC